MKPFWFAIPPEHLDSDCEAEQGLSEIPLKEMWPDDELWMPLLLKGQYFVCRIDMGMNDNETRLGSWEMEKWWFGTLTKAEGSESA